jgi:16S rRNA (guanine966-N2)-methyltransferase
MLGPVAGARVLDLFAGSGALGIEALSRGAAAAVFVDSDPRAVACVRANLAALGAAGTVARRDALAFLTSPERAREPPFDLAFLDPPYSYALRLARPLTEGLPKVLEKHATIVSESSKRAPLELALPVVRVRDYGDTRIAIHRVR